MKLLSIFTGAMEKAGGAKALRRTADRLQSVENDPFPDRVSGDTFEEGGCYFGVRLAGLHLVDARRFATQVLPLCVCLADFTFDGQPRSVPFSMGPDVLRKRLSDAGVNAKAAQATPAWVELADLRVVRPTPVNADNLSIYAGLFSVPGDDFVGTLLNVVGNVSSAVGVGSAIGPGLKVAETVYSSFGALLGTDRVRQEVAALNGTALTKSGYLLIANAPPQVADVGSLRVVKGRLCWPEQGQPNGAVVTEFDYCLLAIEFFKTVVESASGIAPVLFSEPWKAVMAALGAKKREAAADAYDRLEASIMTSPDLIEADRVALLGGYLALYDKYLVLKGLKAPESSVRGRADKGITGQILGFANTTGRKMLSVRMSHLYDAMATHVAPTDEDAFGSDDAVLSAAQSIRQKLLQKRQLSQDPNDDAELAAALGRVTVGYQPSFG